MLTSPLVLAPVLVPKPWGGHRLAALGRHEDVTRKVGESWEVVDLPADATPVPDPVSRVVGGPHDGRALVELIEDHPDALLGTASPSAEGRFPLLVKVLDAAETLSVQVHPPRSLDAARYKTESWIVLDAKPGAELLLGVRAGVTLEDVRGTIGTADLLDLLQAIPARRGDVVHLPAGMIHALGAGVLVAEVQTPSDTTHRLWDWPDQRDGGRELHIEEGLAAIAAGWKHNLGVTTAPATDGELVSTDAYRLSRVTLGPDQGLPATADDVVQVVIVLDGELAWDDPHLGDRSLTRTECVVLPAACRTRVRAMGNGATVLVSAPTPVTTRGSGGRRSE